MERHLEINPRRRRPSNLDSAKTIEDLRALARARLPNFIYEYLEGGAEDETTLRRNRAVFSQFPFSQKSLVDVSKRDLSVKILGKTSAMPVVVAPTGGNGLLWPQGDLAMARAAVQAGIPYAQSTVSMMRVSEVAQESGVRHWFQLYAFGEPRVRQQLIERALKAGSEALVVTIDGVMSGNREWDRRSYAAPGVLTWRNKFDVLRYPGWLWRTLLSGGMPNMENLVDLVDVPKPNMFDISKWIGRNDPHITWESLRDIRRQWPHALLLKGVMRTEDVLRAAEAGVDGVVLSNHGGRQVEPTISPLEILAPTRRAVGPDFTLLVDSGFRRGADVAIALALGANAVMLGRALLYGLAVGGQGGASAALEMIRSEFDRTLALIGAPNAQQLSPDALASPI